MNKKYVEKAKSLLTRNNIIFSTAGVILFVIFMNVIIQPGTAEVASYTVTKGPFVISINTTGEVIAKNSVTITAPFRVRSSLQIVALAEEGSRAKKGDLLIMFDTSDIDTRIEERDATLQQALEDLEKLKATQASEMASLMSQYEVTKNNYELSKIRLNRMEYEAETRKQMEELNFKNAEINLKKLEENISNQKIINEVDFQNAKLRIERAQRDLDEAKLEREKLIIRAPTDGLVVYKEDHRSSTREKIKVGDTPHRRMALIELPDLSVMQVKTSVNEIDIRKIEKGQKAIIRLDAVQNSVITGKVTDIAYLARRELDSNVKVFDILVTIDGGENPLLKPGMSASVEIVLEKMDDKISIPMESVYKKDDKTVAYVFDSGWEEREITIGKINSDYAVVEEGLDVGEKVALRNPEVQLEQFGTEIGGQTENRAVTSRNGGNSSPSGDRGRMMYRRR